MENDLIKQIVHCSTLNVTCVGFNHLIIILKFFILHGLQNFLSMKWFLIVLIYFDFSFVDVLPRQ